MQFSKHKYFLLLLLISSYSAFSEITEVEFIKGLKLIRISIQEAPGMGDQAIAFDVAKRLRELGFTGNLEFIYEERAQNKISSLLGTPIVSNQITEFPNEKYRFIPTEYFNDHRTKFEKADLAISPSFISEGLGRTNYTVENAAKINPIYLNSNTLIILQPTGFYDSQIANGNQLITVPNSKNLPIKSKDVIDSPHILVAEDPRSNFLNSLLDSRNKIDFGVGYGLGLYDGPIKVYRYLLGMKLTENKRRDLSKPLVFALISKFNNEEKEKLFSLIASNPILKDKVGVVDSGSPNASSIIDRNHLDGKISLSFLGNVPKEIFESLMKQSPFPPTVAGANSISLMQNLGRPYLVSTFYNYTDDRRSIDRDARLKFMKASTALSRLNEPHEESAELLSQYFLEALDPNSNINNGFRASPSDDRLSLSIRTLANNLSVCATELTKIGTLNTNSTAP